MVMLKKCVMTSIVDHDQTATSVWSWSAPFAQEKFVPVFKVIRPRIQQLREKKTSKPVIITKVSWNYNTIFSIPFRDIYPYQ